MHVCLYYVLLDISAIWLIDWKEETLSTDKITLSWVAPAFRVDNKKKNNKTFRHSTKCVDHSPYSRITGPHSRPEQKSGTASPSSRSSICSGCLPMCRPRWKSCYICWAAVAASATATYPADAAAGGQGQVSCNGYCVLLAPPSPSLWFSLPSSSSADLISAKAVVGVRCLWGRWAKMLMVGDVTIVLLARAIPNLLRL